ncbi:carbohydrate binding domain-containing protein [Desulfatibacillum aliphaticivorans]|uniref:carbohydrate binding domain-containing protein n=1 Tax=Desulfatibacillum aliphaticivorans TaxID=218208 RepID=UPI00040DCF00|nr:carbohydrate binding domain-containing protein [Desulfatibacillum aliphaticivorans]
MLSGFSKYNGFGGWKQQYAARMTDFSTGKIPYWLSGAGAFVDVNGLHVQPSFYSPEQVTNGTFAETSTGPEINSGDLTSYLGHYMEIQGNAPIELVSNGNFALTSLGSEITSGDLADYAGHYVEIAAQDSVDFTLAGAPDNAVGTRFIADGTSLTLSATDSIQEAYWDDTTLYGRDGSNYVQPGETGGLRLISDNTSAVYFRKEISVVAGTVQRLLVNCTIAAGDVRLGLYDVTNSQDISASANMGWSSGDNELCFVAPDGCTSIRVYFYRDNTGATDITYTGVSVQQQSLGENIVPNGDFEDAGIGGDDVFANFDEYKSDGAINNEAIIVYSGSHSCKLTAGVSVDTRVGSANRTVIPGASYMMSFWTCGDGSYGGRYYIYNNIGGTYIVGATSTGVSDTTWTKISFVFTIPDGCTRITPYFKCPSTEGGKAYFDEAAIQQILPRPDYTEMGAASNEIGTRFVCTSSTATVIPGYELKEVSWDGWLMYQRDASNYVLPGDSGGIRMVGSSANVNIYKTLTTVAGGVYKLEIDCSIDAGSVRLEISDGILSAVVMDWTTGVNYYYFVAVDTSTQIKLWRYGVTTDITYRSISCKQQSLGAVNLIETNPGFETGDITGWPGDDGDGSYTISGTSHYGDYALQLTRGGAASPYRYQNFDVEPGKHYAVGFHNRSDGTGVGWWGLYDRANSEYIQTSIETGITDTSYKPVNFCFTASEGCTSVRLLFWGPGVGDTWYDDAWAREILEGAEYIPDPHFDDPTAWTIGASWDVSDGRATVTAGGGDQYLEVVSPPSFDGLYLLAQAGAVSNLKIGQSTLSAFEGGTLITPSQSVSKHFMPTKGYGAGYILYGYQDLTDGYLDYVSVRKPEQSSLYCVTRAPNTRILKAPITALDDELSGLIMALDDPDDPQNFIAAVIDAADANSLKVYSVTTALGWRQPIIESSISYVDGGIIQIERVGNVYTFSYGADLDSLAQVGTDQEIINANLGDWHGYMGTGPNSYASGLYIR